MSGPTTRAFRFARNALVLAAHEQPHLTAGALHPGAPQRENGRRLRSLTAGGGGSRAAGLLQGRPLQPPDPRAEPPMRLIVAAVGRAGSDPAGQLFEDYRRRLPWPLELREARAGGGGAKGREREAAALLKGLPQTAFVVALDGGGEALTSEAFAARIADERDRGTPVDRLPHRRGRRAGGGGARPRRHAALARADDLAAPARPRHAGGTALARRQHPFRPPLSPRLSRGRREPAPAKSTNLPIK